VTRLEASPLWSRLSRSRRGHVTHAREPPPSSAIRGWPPEVGALIHRFCPSGHKPVDGDVLSPEKHEQFRRIPKFSTGWLICGREG
jgi:hypothetical protein